MPKNNTIHVQGDDGRMQGRVSLGGKTPPVSNDIPKAETEETVKTGQGIENLYEAFHLITDDSDLADLALLPLEDSEVTVEEVVQAGIATEEEVTAVAEETAVVEETVEKPAKAVKEKKKKVPLVRSSPAVSAIFTLSRTSAPFLDDLQRASAYQSLVKAAGRWTPTPQPPSEEEWQTWVSGMSEQVRIKPGIPERTKTRVIDRLNKAMTQALPSGSEFAAMKYFETQLNHKTRWAMQEQAMQIGGWVGASEETVQTVIARHRAEYLAMPKRQRPEVPEQFVKGFRLTSPNVPRDDATIYSHWKASDSSNYESDAQFTKYVSFDLETTGFSAKNSHIIEIGAVFYDADGNELERWSSLIRPPLNEEGVLDTGPTDVHGIFPEDVADAPTFAELSDEIRERFQGACVVGHNIGFDTHHLHSSLSKDAVAHGKEMKKDPWVATADTYWEAARTMDDVPNNQLSTVAAKLGYSYTDGHRALHDAVVTGEVFFGLKRKRDRPLMV